MREILRLFADKGSVARRAASGWLPTVLAVLLAFLLVAPVTVPAQADPQLGYDLKMAPVESELHIPILVYRWRHPEVTFDRNVAAFEFTRNGTKLIAVGPSIDRNPNNTKTALIDIYRQDPKTGELTLVDRNGEPIKVNNKVLNWRDSSEPSYSWDLKNDPNMKSWLSIGIHSEPLLSKFLELKVDGAQETTTRGLSERKPCDYVTQQCRIRLAKQYFHALELMQYITDFPSSRELSELKKEHPENARGLVTAAQYLQGVQRDFARAMEEGPGLMSRADLEYGLFATPGSEHPSGALASALSPGSDPGGIDFSSLQLRYLSEGSHGRLQYSFNAASGAPSLHNVGAGRKAATQASDAFFVWLSMPKSSFWVNLNPNEPNRIVDHDIGSTDVGRIMLQADFRMKKLVGKLIYPDTKLGKKFWGSTSAAGCIDMRQWIVPAPATVYQHDGGIQIVNAPLNVKMESDYLKDQGETSCVHPNAGMERSFRTLVLPKVIKAVNHAPEFTELRRIYLSRVAAEWYRQQHGQRGALASLIDSGDISAWPALQSWSPRQVFNQYVHSYRHKEFKVTKKTTKGHTVYKNTYTYGGVDFSTVPLHNMSSASFDRDHPGLSGDVRASTKSRTEDGHGGIWLGSSSTPYFHHAAQVSNDESVHADGAKIIIVVALSLGGAACIGLVVGIALGRGRRRRMIIGGTAVVLVASLIAGLVAINRIAHQATVSTPSTAPPIAAPSTAPASARRTTVPTPTQSVSQPPTHPTANPKHSPKPKHMPKHKHTSKSTSPWSKPKRGHRPSSAVLSQTWHKRDGADLQQLEPLTFSFAVPHSYTCLSYPIVNEVGCGPKGMGDKDPHIVIKQDTCGCTVKQVTKIVNTNLNSKRAYRRLLPVDAFTRISDNGNGKMKYQYWMSKVYSTGHDHRLDHHILVYAQAKKSADAIAMRKIIGDIYDATRAH